jgi:hypothetical protein
MRWQPSSAFGSPALLAILPLQPELFEGAGTSRLAG